MSSQPTASPFNRTRVQELKWEATLDAASALFNERGHTGTSLAELSKRLNVSKRTVYNYVRNKDDLVFHCYTRTIDSSLGILTDVVAGDGNGLTKIRAYMRAQLHDGQPTFAVVTEISSLSPPRAAQIRADAKQCRLLLQQIIREGIADGSIAPCNEALTAMAIFSIISWVPMWFSRSGTLSLDEVVETFEDVLAHGLRRDTHPGIPASSLDDMVSLPCSRDRQDIGEIKREALLKAATALFNQDGISGTSIDDVVQSLGVTKGAVYYYFENKEELLAGCYERSLEFCERIIEHVEHRTDDPLKRIYLNLRLLSDTHAGPDGPMMIFTGLDNLSEKRRKTVIARGWAQERYTGHWIDQGISAGMIRNVNALLVRFMIAGAMDSLPKWYRDDGANTPQDIADCYFNLFSEGLQPRHSHPHSGVNQ